MSDLNHKTVSELHCLKASTEKYISELNSKLNGQKQRLEWIEKYIFEKTPKEMSIKQIEMALGHKIIIK